MAFDVESIREEVRHWFFDVYFNHWVEVGAGKRDEGPEFILQYWGTPMYASCDEPDIAAWLNTGEEIVGFLVMQQERIRAAGYDHTEVPDSKVFVYNPKGAGIEVIWSRQAADNTEIQRLAAHFECVKFNGTWKVVGVQARVTNKDKDGDALEAAWN